MANPRVAGRVRASPAVLTLLAATLAVLALPTAQAAFGMPEGLTDRGQTVGGLYDIITILGIIVFVIVFIWLVVVIWRFRETSGHGRATHERERHNIWAELAWFVVPLILVLSIGYMAYGGLIELDHGVPAGEADVEVLITGSQWSWAATYPGGVTMFSNPDQTTGAVKNESVFRVPAGKAVTFNVTATDVIHAFQVLDANHAFVIFVDANPLGANKYNLQTVRLPEGDYYVQCNKMCLNPGHAYMRARIKAVPEAEYSSWLNEKAASGGNDIVQKLPLQLQGNAVVGTNGQALGTQTVVAGTTIVVDLRNPGQDVAFSITGVGTGAQVGAATKTIRAGETADPFFGFTLGNAGMYTLQATAGGQTTEIAFEAKDAKRITVELDNFKLIPDTITMERGQTYLITIPNLAAAVHDLYIGNFDPSKPDNGAIWHSTAVGANGSGTFIVETGDQEGTFEMWCNQPGHRGLGMTGTAHVG